MLSPIAFSREEAGGLDFGRSVVGIFDIPEVEGVAGHGCAGGTAVLGGDNLTETVNRQFSTTDVDKRADDGSHHVTKKPVGRYFKLPVGAVGRSEERRGG